MTTASIVKIKIKASEQNVLIIEIELTQSSRAGRENRAPDFDGEKSLSSLLIDTAVERKKVTNFTVTSFWLATNVHIYFFQHDGIIFMLHGVFISCVWIAFGRTKHKINKLKRLIEPENDWNQSETTKDRRMYNTVTDDIRFALCQIVIAANEMWNL